MKLVKAAALVAMVPGLVACSTLQSLIPDGLSFLPKQTTRVILPDVPGNPQSTFVATDLITVLSDYIPMDSSLAIVSKESSDWGPLEDGLRKRGYRVTAVKRMKDAKGYDAVMFNVALDEELDLYYGTLSVGSDLEASRFYTSDVFITDIASPATVRTPDGLTTATGADDNG